MSTFTAGDQIARALRLLGVLAEGETPSASESNDALIALNQMIDSWNTESLTVFATTDQPFTWPAGQITRSLGPTGDFVGVRPVTLDDSTYYTLNGISYPVEIVGDGEYNAIPLKTITTTLPQILYPNPSYPNMSIVIYPVPTQDLLFHFISATPLDQPALLTTVLSVPPGYLRAFAYNLAMEIAPEFGVEPSKDVRRVAMISKRDIKRVNQSIDKMSMPAGIPMGGSGFNLYTGR